MQRGAVLGVGAVPPGVVPTPPAGASFVRFSHKLVTTRYGMCRHLVGWVS